METNKSSQSTSPAAINNSENTSTPAPTTKPVPNQQKSVPNVSSKPEIKSSPVATSAKSSVGKF